MTVGGLWLFLAVSLFGLQCLIVVFPDYTHLLFRSFIVAVGLNKKCYMSKIRREANS